MGTDTVAARGAAIGGSSERGGDFYLATRGDLELATRGDFLWPWTNPKVGSNTVKVAPLAADCLYGVTVPTFGD